VTGSILIVDDEASLLDFLSVSAPRRISVSTARSVREPASSSASAPPTWCSAT